jgi:hypothetical protein
VILQERLDGSLWVSHEAAVYPLRVAPPDPGQLRARHLSVLAAGTPDLDLERHPDPEPGERRRPSCTAGDLVGDASPRCQLPDGARDR